MGTTPPDTSRQTRLLVFVAISAAFLAIAVPPVGLACGVGTLVVLGVRHRRKLTLPRPAVVVALTAAAAVIPADGRSPGLIVAGSAVYLVGLAVHAGVVRRAQPQS